MAQTGKILAALGALGLFLLLPKRQANAASITVEDVRVMDDSGNEVASLLHPYQAEIQDAAQQWGLDPLLVAAICAVESSFRPLAHSADNSYGLMQVLCIPDGNGGCRNHLDLPGWSDVKANDLYDVTTALYYGCGILAYNQQHFGYWRGVATYNRWASRNDPEDGPYGNQIYVNKVRAFYDQFASGRKWGS